MPLTDTQIKALKPEAKARKHADEKGLFLLVTPSGGKLWRLKYRVDGKEKLLALGAYPEVSLKAARARRDDARRVGVALRRLRPLLPDQVPGRGQRARVSHQRGVRIP